jgi:hypothetical protein
MKKRLKEEERLDEENKKLYGWLNPKGSFIRNRGYNIHGDTYTKFTGVRKTDYWDKIADATSKGWQRLDLYKNDDKTVDGVIQGERKKWTPRHGKSLARIKKAIGADGYKNMIQKVPHINEEQLDELKDATHMSYRAKARNQIDKMANRLGNKMMADTVDTKKMKNRADGIKQSYKLQPGLKKKKLKEANEPFEGPYVQKGKEKSNPDRRASTIAHKALKAVKKKMRKGETEKQWRKRMQDRYETLQYKGD